MHDTHQIIATVLQELRAQAEQSPKCTAEPCHDPLCPLHAEDELERLDSAAWTPPAGAEPWRSLRDGKLNLGAILDHTILRPEATRTVVEAACREALDLRCAAFCANPIHIPLVAQLLRGSPVAVCTVVGFPLGATPTAIKIEETRWVLAQGAREIDMVISIGMLKGRQYREVFEDISTVVQATHQAGALCKVILETALLSPREKIAACLLASRAGADFVKTSTGYGKSGATPEDVALMRAVVGNSLGIKAAGGIRTRTQALAMVSNGANRIGTSSSLAIVSDRPSQGGS